MLLTVLKYVFLFRLTSLTPRMWIKMNRSITVSRMEYLKATYR